LVSPSCIDYGTVSQACGMPGICCGGAFCGESNGATISVSGWLASKGLSEPKNTGLGSIKAATVVVYGAGLVAEGPQHGIVKSFCGFYIVGTQHHMTKHCDFAGS
jgi:hypothetical protein